ncbi:MAG: AmmeMemoRadiSam system radical SAM enzyme [Candidatus Neomarinimicrobiota bacterium]|jgi:pyruvate formate lyase activating enzyme|nr:AmmeMemoRadiSam system radical SAM enzyme [Candidatus Neomarinimicrobiota bacterium]MDD3966395.1 AmmeMemoRadiSam system radical SAM enzyme [Candidatus Neomarinimicrobiota bacterium]
MNNQSLYPEARFWKRKGESILCELCPHACILHEGQSGLCGSRIHEAGKLRSTVYGYPSALQSDPIEKKPLFHFLPGTRTFSIGTQGCNLSCKFCQNWHLSAQHGREHEYVSPKELVLAAKNNRCKSIAFTYNEPIIFAEYALDIIDLAEQEKIPCIFVTNGYVSELARETVFSGLRAVNIDLKAFSDTIYRHYTGGSLRPVLDTILWCVNKGIHTEITTLLIPGVNDDDLSLEKSTQWIVKNCGEDTPLHLTAFHPDYMMTDHPGTSRQSLERARKIATASGLRYVYVGNYPGFDNNTYCPQCGEIVIERKGYQVTLHKEHQHSLPIIRRLP